MPDLSETVARVMGWDEAFPRGVIRICTPCIGNPTTDEMLEWLAGIGVEPGVEWNEYIHLWSACITLVTPPRPCKEWDDDLHYFTGPTPHAATQQAVASCEVVNETTNH